MPTNFFSRLKDSHRGKRVAFFFGLALLTSLPILWITARSTPSEPTRDPASDLLSARKSPPSEAAIRAGKRTYQTRCSFCHGSEGKGDGPVAERLDPKPRDFVQADFKIRSTAWGSLPTDEDLFGVITRGIPGTAMPPWGDALNEEQRWQLVHYVKTFSHRFTKEGPPRPISIGKEAQPASNTIARGQEIFKKMKCFLCHGEKGRGDGPIGERLRYEWDFPFVPRNLTKGWTFKAGSSTRDIYRTLSTGMNGTPMGSYAHYLSEEERWALAHYVQSLSSEAETGTPSGVVLKSEFLKTELPEEPADPLWEMAKPLGVPLSGQIITRPRLWAPSIDTITARSLHNDTDIAFLLEWDDRTNGQDEIFRDALLVQFPVHIPRGPLKPYLLMGQPGKPVNLWHGRAPWRRPAEEESDGASWTVAELNASGYQKTPSPQAPESRDLRCKALWDQGRWKVAIKRRLSTEDKKKDVQFEPGIFIPIAFHVWDGANGEIGLKRSISSWYYVQLESSPSPGAYLLALLSTMAVAGLEVQLARRARKKPPEGAHESR